MSNITIRKQDYQKYVNDLIWNKIAKERENALMFGSGFRRDEEVVYSIDLKGIQMNFLKYANMTQTKGNKKPIEKKLYTYYI